MEKHPLERILDILLDPATDEMRKLETSVLDAAVEWAGAQGKPGRFEAAVRLLLAAVKAYREEEPDID